MERKDYGIRVFWRNRSTEDLWYSDAGARDDWAAQYRSYPAVSKVVPIGVGGEQVVGSASDGISLHR